MSKLFLTQHLNQVFTHKRKMEKIADEQSAIKENEVFKLRQEAVAKEVAKERIAQDQPRQERIIQEQTTLRVEQERIALEKLTLKTVQEAFDSERISIQEDLKEERAQLDKEKAEHERVINTIILNEVNEIKGNEDNIAQALGNDGDFIILNETNETIVEDDNTVQLIGNDSDFIII